MPGRRTDKHDKRHLGARVDKNTKETGPARAHRHSAVSEPATDSSVAWDVFSVVCQPMSRFASSIALARSSAAVRPLWSRSRRQLRRRSNPAVAPDGRSEPRGCAPVPDEVVVGWNKVTRRPAHQKARQALPIRFLIHRRKSRKRSRSRRRQPAGNRRSASAGSAHLRAGEGTNVMSVIAGRFQRLHMVRMNDAFAMRAQTRRERSGRESSPRPPERTQRSARSKINSEFRHRAR